MVIDSDNFVYSFNKKIKKGKKQLANGVLTPIFEISNKLQIKSNIMLRVVPRLISYCFALLHF